MCRCSSREAEQPFFRPFKPSFLWQVKSSQKVLQGPKLAAALSLGAPALRNFLVLMGLGFSFAECRPFCSALCKSREGLFRNLKNPFVRRDRLSAELVVFKPQSQSLAGRLRLNETQFAVCTCEGTFLKESRPEHLFWELSKWSFSGRSTPSA